MKNKLLHLLFVLVNLYIISNAFAYNDSESGKYFDVSVGYSHATNLPITTEKINGTYSNTVTNFYNSYPFIDYTHEKGTINLNGKLSTKSQGLVPLVLAMELGYNYNKYLGFGVELSQRSIVLSSTGTANLYNATTNKFYTTTKTDPSLHFIAYTPSLKATGYFPINNTFSLYGNLGIGVTIIGKVQCNYDENCDYIKHNLMTGSIGVGVKITLGEYGYLKIGSNITAIQSIIDQDNLNKDLKDALIKEGKSPLTDIDYNINVTSSNPKNIFRQEFKITIGHQF